MSTCNLNPYQVIANDPTLKSLKILIDLAGFQSTVASLANSTMFCPTDASIANNPSIYNYLIQPANIATLKSVLLYHITGKALTTLDLYPTRTLLMLNNSSLFILNNIYLQFVPVCKDNMNQQYNVVEGNLATSTGTFLQKINGVLQPYYIPYPIIVTCPYNPRCPSNKI